MNKLYVVASALFLSLLTVTVTHAQCYECGQHGYGSSGEGFHAGYHANVEWPRMYIPAARHGMCQTFNAMINNGWRRQNLLGDYHFNPNTNQLTEAGRLKVNWILTQAPAHHRNIYVQRGKTEDQTSDRIAAVHDDAGQISPSLGPVQVNDTHIVAEGHRASSVDSVFVGFQDNRPIPVLPASTGSSSSGDTN